MPGLREVADGYVNAAVSKKTLKAKRTGARKYMVFARRAGLRTPEGSYICPKPATLVGFATLRGLKGDSLNTIKLHLRGAGQWFLWSCGRDPGLGPDGQLHPVLAACLRGIGKSTTMKRRPKEALTVDKLKLCLLYLDDLGLAEIDVRMYRAALLLAVFGLLRIGELTSPTQTTFDPRKNAQLMDIQFIYGVEPGAMGMQFHIKAAKTDTYNEGQDVKIMSTGVAGLCPVRAMQKWFRAFSPARARDDALFRDSKCRLLTRGMFVKVLRQVLSKAGFNPKLYSSHACRRGGCQTLAEAGMSEHAIKVHGRWKSDVYLVYLRLTDRAHRIAARRMARVGFLSEETSRRTAMRLMKRKLAK